MWFTKTPQLDAQSVSKSVSPSDAVTASGNGSAVAAVLGSDSRDWNTTQSGYHYICLTQF